jgi:dephospho-CoA kinase
MKYFHELQEGVYDPNIFKAFFLAGGPGSGKSLVVQRITRGFGLKVVDSDPHFEKLIQKAQLSLKMPDDEFDSREPLRVRAKAIREKRKANYVEGRLGMLIDGTAKDAKKLIKQSIDLEVLGYDTHMIFVNTSLDVALMRNSERPRSVPESEVILSHKNVQSNIGAFSQHFSGGRFIAIDNNDPLEKMEKDIFPKVWKIIKRLAEKKVSNPRAKNWISMELAKKAR